MVSLLRFKTKAKHSTRYCVLLLSREVYNTQKFAHWLILALFKWNFNKHLRLVCKRSKNFNIFGFRIITCSCFCWRDHFSFCSFCCQKAEGTDSKPIGKIRFSLHLLPFFFQLMHITTTFEFKLYRGEDSNFEPNH